MKRISDRAIAVGAFEAISAQQAGMVHIKTTNGQVRLQFYNDATFRVTINSGEDIDDFSYSVIGQVEPVNIQVVEQSHNITLKGPYFHVIYAKKDSHLSFYTPDGHLINQDEPGLPPMKQGCSWTAYKHLLPEERIIGLGEKTGNLNRRGSAFTNWNSDSFDYQVEQDPIYASIPFYQGITHAGAYGIFLDNTFKSHFNMGASNNRFASFGAEDGDLNYYFFYESGSVADVIKHYTWLTGRPDLPPKWSLGLQQCRYSYYPDKEVLRMARTYREKGIPADVIYLDIHYMDEYRVFTWHPTRFPDPKKMIAELKQLGFRVVVIIDPGVKVDKNYHAFLSGLEADAFVKYPDGEVYQGQVWPGWCHFPDFTKPDARQWWANQFQELVSDGIAGFWNDMNEPATWGQSFPDLVEFDYEGQLSSHKRAHNVYGMQMSRATNEGAAQFLNNQRSFVLTRAAFAGSQRYAAIWTGDNNHGEDHMMLGVRLVNSLGLSGYGFAGVDIGGFVGDCDAQTFARWMSIGAFSPMFRIHSMIDSKASDPWSYGERVEYISRNYINLRYQLMPYIYAAFKEMSETGMPVCRSLCIDYPQDNEVYNFQFHNQYLFGNEILVAPTSPGQGYVDLYLPGHQTDHWYDWHTGERLEGGRHLVHINDLERLPLFVKEGALIPMQSTQQHSQDKHDGVLRLHLFEAHSGTNSTRIYEDDGLTNNYLNGDSVERLAIADWANKKLTLTASCGEYASEYDKLELVFHCTFGTIYLKTDGQEYQTKTVTEPLLPAVPKFDPYGNADHAEYRLVEKATLKYEPAEMVITWR